MNAMNANTKYVKCLPAPGHDQYSKKVVIVDLTTNYGAYLNWENCIAVTLHDGETMESKGYEVVK